MNMKKYFNSTTNEWYFEGLGMHKRLSNNSLFFGIPTIELLTEWGFTEYVEPTPTPEDLLQKAKDSKITELESYDSSDEVNSFYLGGLQMWLSREDRTLIDESINAYENMGATEMTKYFNGIAYTFPLALWKLMLNSLVVYASEALNVTEYHKATIMSLLTILEVEDYDFTDRYPSKLNFNI